MASADVAAVAAIEGADHASQAALLEELARPWGRLWVALSPDESVMGFLSAWQVVDELHILNVATRTRFRRRGVGEQLLRTAIEYAKSNAIQTLLLEVRVGNAPAIALYRKAGFSATNVRRNYYPDGEDALGMDLLLDPTSREIVRKADDITR